jgi:hypothetical protein
MTSGDGRAGRSDLRVGDVVEVRNLDEILATLDENGELESLPFMPEMVQFCGQRLVVEKIAHKLCDTISSTGMRKMENAVHLAGARCDGSGHDGCQAQCLIYWKTDWLIPRDRITIPDAPREDGGAPRNVPPVISAASRGVPDEDGTARYRCQATEILRAAPEPLPIRNLGQFVTDVRTRNLSVRSTAVALFVALFNRVQKVYARALPRSLKRFAGHRWAAVIGRPGKTPTGRLDLQPGELVRVRSRREIAETVDDRSLNRGLGFDSEMTRSCGKTARVAGHVDRIIDERTGKMLTMKQPCVLLEGIYCEGAYNSGCPRRVPPYWREIWLERVDEPSGVN